MIQKTQHISRRSERSVAPLSFAQQRLWFLQQLDPVNPGYNNLLMLRLAGPLQGTALQRGLDEIIRRHEILRTSFVLLEGQLMQRIASPFALPLARLDLRSLAATEPNAQIQRLALQEMHRPFDLTHGPLIRACLLELDDEAHILFLTLHRIIYDGRSIDILFQELAALYRADATGHPSPLPEPPIQYADFAIWQRQQLQGAFLEERLTYWKRRLDGALSILQLPADHQRPAIQTLRGARQLRLLSGELTAQVEMLSRQEKVTLFMILLAAFQILLLRYTGQQDLVVGTAITDRTQTELENLIGIFDNMLALRTDLSGNPTCQQALRQVREVVLGAYEHRDVPFEKLVEVVQPERRSGYNPLFQVAFAYQEAPLTPPEFVGLQVDLLEFDPQVATFDLELACTRTEQGLLCSIEYSTDLFEEATISRMLGHFEVLLKGIVEHPERRLSELPMLTQRERQQLLVEWNASATDYARDRCVQQLFEEQVQRTPEMVAVIYEDKQLTYQELNRQANQLAHYLRALGVGPEVHVGICVQRSVEMVIGLLGILKAGGVYVPLDPAYPAERLSYMLQDAQVLVLLTQQRLLAQLPIHEVTIVCLDSASESIVQQSEANPFPLARGEHAAYIIYTSGSTGQPKGVVIQGRSLTNLCYWYKRSSHITQASVVLMMLPSGVDASIKNMVTPLLAGGQLIIAPVGHYDAAELLDIIEKRKVTVINSAPSLFYTITDAAKMDNYRSLSSVKYLHLGGDALTLSKLRPWLQSAHCHCSVANIYGPTECTDISASYTVAKADIDVRETVPIGRPIDNVHLYVLDKEGNPQPIGLVGELCIGGEGVGRGYLNKAALTAEKFVPDPFVSGARMYKTGDRARWLPDGNLEFLGRVDHQVKVRGLRVELGEIEAALNQQPGVREAVALAREDLPGGENRLVAYVIPRPGHNLTSDMLRSSLKEKLPEHMLPSIFMLLESFPYTASSKVDRQALPPPKRDRFELEEAFVAPRTAVEKILAGIWAEVLGLERVGVSDNFFSIGGDSILSIQVVTRARQAGLQLTTKHLFQHQTIAQLAAIVGVAHSVPSG
jgi:amino acid adenylation domain-containing protein